MGCDYPYERVGIYDHGAQSALFLYYDEKKTPEHLGQEGR